MTSIAFEVVFLFSLDKNRRIAELLTSLLGQGNAERREVTVYVHFIADKWSIWFVGLVLANTLAKYRGAKQQV